MKEIKDSKERNKLSAWFSTVAVLALAVGCAAPAASPKATVQAAQPQAAANPAPASAGPKVKIRLSTWTGIEEAKELQAVIDKVNAQATSYEIVHEPQPADYYTKIQTNLAGGTAADLLWLSQENITGYADKGVLLDISDYLKNDVRPAAKLDDYFPNILRLPNTRTRPMACLGFRSRWCCSTTLRCLPMPACNRPPTHGLGMTSRPPPRS